MFGEKKKRRRKQHVFPQASAGPEVNGLCPTAALLSGSRTRCLAGVPCVWGEQHAQGQLQVNANSGNRSSSVPQAGGMGQSQLAHTSPWPWPGICHAWRQTDGTLNHFQQTTRARTVTQGRRSAVQRWKTSIDLGKTWKWSLEDFPLETLPWETQREPLLLSLSCWGVKLLDRLLTSKTKIVQTFYFLGPSCDSKTSPLRS